MVHQWFIIVVTRGT